MTKLTNSSLSVAIKAAKEAGRELIKYYGKTSIKFKQDKSIVTEADLVADKLIKKVILSSYPTHAVLSEETGLSDSHSDYLWIIDPLDGTTNFSVQNPFFAVSIGLIYKNKPVLGVVYSPIQNELFYAEIRKGAYMNDSLIEVDKNSNLENSFISFNNGRDEKSKRRMIQIFKDIKMKNNVIRQVGAAALELCYLAVGRFGAFIMPGVSSWDVLAGSLIVNEAHGVTTDFHGKEFNIQATDLLAGSPVIHQSLIEIINRSLTV
ncbi:MAG: inositol monophosphatase family protein [Candidatus Hodarchaeales archaeon]|jgi:myo-inositol-1(or 4)-monophosphatase